MVKKNIKVLVTGGAGFIGSCVVDKLIARGDSVVIVDNLATGKLVNVNKKAKFYNMDVSSEKLEQVFQKERPEYVIHLAAQVDVNKSLKDPMFDARINIIGSLNLLDNCVKYGVKKFVYSNSGGAGSGEPQYLPVDEEHPIEPLSFYGISKHTVEHYLFAYHHIHGLPYVSLRYANVYGPRQDPFGEGGVVAIFSYHLMQNTSPKIFGNGKQTRDFVYVGDVADANIMALNYDKCDFFNISTGVEITINDLYKEIQNITKSKVQPIYTDARKGDIFRSVLSCKKIKKLMGWTPKVKLSDGLRSTIDFFRKEKR
jgi:UDP-glucose 4-epimerase